jgi:hypothetical protein
MEWANITFVSHMQDAFEEFRAIIDTTFLEDAGE